MVKDETNKELTASKPDRQRAILTKRERKYFLGQSDIEPRSQAERTLRQNVRARLTNAILDFPILAQKMEQRDLDRVFRAEIEVDGAPERMSTEYVKRSMIDMVALMFRVQDNPVAFANTIEKGIKRAALVTGHDARVDVDIDVELTRSVDEIRERLEASGPEALGSRELRLLRDAGELDAERYHEILLERHRRADDLVDELTDDVDE